MENAPPPPIVLEPRDGVSASVIWLHGLGADGHDFAPLVPHLGARRYARFVFPNAPMIPVSINQGMVMRAWYDIAARSGRLVSDEAGIRSSQDGLERLIDGQHDGGVPYHRVVVAGFSQGGAIALHTALRFPHRLAGLLALSTYVPLPEDLPAERSDANATLPILMAHGQHDPLIELARAEHSRDLLLSLGYPLEWRTYPMAHAVSGPEIGDIDDWLARIIPG
jgi:phospholipase/carboxylesterase